MPVLQDSVLLVARARRGGRASRLWREWCFLRAAWRQFRVNFLLIVGLLFFGGGLFLWLEPEKHKSLLKAVYYTWVLVFGQPPEEFPDAPALRALFFLVPLVGLVVILEGLVDFAFLLRDRRRSERSWCKIMASSYSNHIILVGLGKLGYRVFCMLRKLGEPVAVIEHNAENQFLEDIRRDGSPLFIGDARREALLADAHAEAARSIILATNHDLVNLEVALDARRMNSQIRVVLRMFDQNMADKIRAGFSIQTAMSQSALSAPAFVVAGLGASIEGSVSVGDELLVMQRWSVKAGDRLCGKTVAEVMAACGVNIVEYRPAAGEKQLIPPPDTRLNASDEVLVQGTIARLNALAGPCS